MKTSWEMHRIATYRHVKTGIEFNLLPGGKFEMGSNDGDSDEKPTHEVTVPPFLIGVTPVTQAQLTAMGVDHASYFKGDHRPAENMTWSRAKEWAEDVGFRLPSEAEWEYACRAGTTTKWLHGDDEGSLGEYAWYEANAGGKTHGVGTRKPNAFGLRDMLGNVWEWCEDDWHGDYDGAPTNGSPRIDSPRASDRVYRGGSYWDDAGDLRSANRRWFAPGNACGDLGFRVARSL